MGVDDPGNQYAVEYMAGGRSPALDSVALIVEEIAIDSESSRQPSDRRERGRRTLFVNTLHWPVPGDARGGDSSNSKSVAE
jgi:hypothetical protein